MKTFKQLTLVLGLIGFGCALVQAQDNGGAIAVLDVAKVFKENAAFKQQIDAIQARAQQLKAEVEAKQNELRLKAQQINEQFKANTPDRKDAEAALEQEMTGLRTYARQSETELMTQEAKVYYDTYQKMQAIVGATAKANNIALVLRFDSSAISSEDRSSVVAGVNRAVVYQSESDITDYVIAQMGPSVSAADARKTQTK